MTGAIIPFAPSLSERVGRLLERCEYRLVESDGERDSIFRMRYDAYLRERAINSSTTSRLSDRYDEADNARLFAVYVEGRLASSIRLHIVMAEQPTSPALGAFPVETEPFLVAGQTILDPNRFVADFELAHTYPELVYVTLRLPFMAADAFAVDVALATVRDEHRAFYRRVLRYKVVASARPYPTLVKPLGLMMVNFREQRASVLARYPFFAARSGEPKELFGIHGTHKTNRS